ncbi:hypothetical protein N7541_009230 [Penicillium brevicompactum]|uniref:Major facilitator superfamily (MFS) profile domain-containing protein n=1 Tax=Penicillium brevicompactum TaxID=5074 RepID=A0A9W9QLH0_PENBR|nr:hypothetical protein N7541_009230 [Penicillium brevicompactum]
MSLPPPKHESTDTHSQHIQDSDSLFQAPIPDTEHVFLVTWDGPDDPENPQNWPLLKKVCASIAPLSVIFAVSFASSSFGPCDSYVSAEYGISAEVTKLGVALFIAGYAVGPLVFAPMAELFGNVPPLLIALVGCGAFQIPLALAKHAVTIFVSRFLAGVLGSAALAVGSGLLADFYSSIARGAAIAVTACFMNLGSVISPIAAAYISERYGWRWTAWANLIVIGVSSVISGFLLCESSHNRILMLRAARLRVETKNDKLRAHSELHALDLNVLIKLHFTKPIRMFVHEPILILITVYLTLVYGTLYLSYQFFTQNFQNRDWGASTSTLCLAPVGVGVITATVIIATYSLTYYRKRQVELSNSMGQGERILSARLSPEMRLPPMMLGSVILPPALLWFGWSGDVQWACQIISCFFVGCSLQLIFTSGIIYIIDVYMGHTVSAISIHVVVRSLASATFPMFELPMYDRLGISWSSTLLACISFLIMGCPFLMWNFGARVRSWSQFSVDDEI